ncbi:MAG: hypothetical protein DRN90_02475 [Thermoproteota archaeon]|nr:MAG: hypothetical protein DRN90_02475 [Candidatus Korarchaeota archaeon]
MRPEEILRNKLEINKQFMSFLDSLLWTRESPLWKTAFRMVNDIRITYNDLGEIHKVVLLSAICTKLIFSEINAIITNRRAFES